MTHMHCGLDKNRPLHRSTNPARMRLNVWSMVITSCREQCPPPGLQQRADKAVSWWARVTSASFLCAELFLLCNKWEKTRDEVRTKPRHAAGRCRCLCSLHTSFTACMLNSAFNCLKWRNPPHPHTNSFPRCFFYLFQMFLAILHFLLFLFHWKFLPQSAQTKADLLRITLWSTRRRSQLRGWCFICDNWIILN